MTTERIAAIRDVAEHALDNTTDLAFMALNTILRLLDEAEADSTKIGAWPVRTGTEFCGAKIVGANYEEKTITLSWEEPGCGREIEKGEQG